MRLNALLMCRNQHSIRLLARGLAEAGVARELCASAQEAMDLLARGYYSAVVVDFDVPHGTVVARLARVTPPDRRPVVFAMISATTEVGNAFEAGANFVLYKPLVFEQIERSLRAGRGFMKPDRRRSPRQRLETIAYLRCGSSVLPAVVLDVNECGMALQTTVPLPALPEMPFRFVLPGCNFPVEGKGELIWADETGRAGIMFSYLPATGQRHLKDWLCKNAPKAKASGRILARPEKAIQAELMH